MEERLEDGEEDEEDEEDEDEDGDEDEESSGDRGGGGETSVALDERETRVQDVQPGSRRSRAKGQLPEREEGLRVACLFQRYLSHYNQ
ncbi:unnamed protein product [Cutaneotrichosporon oleaginosum]